MATTILVIGSTGTIGSQLVTALASKPDVHVRAAVRSSENAKKAANVTPVDFEFEKPDTIKAAVRGADKVFLITPFLPNQVELGKRAVDAAKAAGVKHLVKLSAMGADQEPGIQLGRWHRAIEKHVEASGVPFTFLRPNNYFENFINYYPPQKDGNIYLPFGSGAVSFIAGGDVAEVGAHVLTTKGHEGKAYELTGPEAITVAQVASALSEVTGRKVSYVDVPEEAARKGMLDAQMPTWMVDAMMELNAIDKAGYAAGVNDTVQKLVGRTPTRFVDWAKKNASAWKA